jgi:hypothetical protein
MSAFGMYPSINDTVRRFRAEREAATASLELALTRECSKLLITQHEPVASLGIDRKALQILLDFLHHHDSERLRREIEEMKEDKT